MSQQPDPTSPSDVPGRVRPERPDPSSTQPIVQTPTAARPSLAGRVDTSGPGAADVAIGTAPAVRPPTWSGRKTAVAAALAVGLGVIGAVGASAAIAQGESVGSDAGTPGGGVPGRRARTAAALPADGPDQSSLGGGAGAAAARAVATAAVGPGEQPGPGQDPTRRSVPVTLQPPAGPSARSEAGSGGDGAPQT